MWRLGLNHLRHHGLFVDLVAEAKGSWGGRVTSTLGMMISLQIRSIDIIKLMHFWPCSIKWSLGGHSYKIGAWNTLVFTTN